MTVYARSDVAAVTISPEHGGCGQVHSRPVVAGAPARLWGLQCEGGCEDVLRNDSHWAGTPHTVPETPDETAIRLDAEKKNQVELQVGNAHALAELAKLGELPTAMAQALAAAFGPLFNATNAQPALAHLCRNGHSNQSDVKFCGECGANMLDAVNKQPAAALSGSEEPAPVEVGVTVTPADPQAETVTEDLESKSLAELREIAREVGAEIARSKVEQIDNIKKAHAK